MSRHITSGSRNQWGVSSDNSRVPESVECVVRELQGPGISGVCRQITPGSRNQWSVSSENSRVQESVECVVRELQGPGISGVSRQITSGSDNFKLRHRPSVHH